MSQKNNIKKYIYARKKERMGLLNIFVCLSLYIIAFVALTTEVIMPEVNIKILDGLIITGTLFCAYLIAAFFHKRHVECLENKLLYQYKCMETIFSNVYISIFLEDVEGRVLTTNAGQLDILGLKPKDVIGKKAEDIFLEMPEEYLKMRKEVFKTKKSAKQEIRIKALDGTYKWFRVGHFPVLNKKNEIENIIILYLNIDKEHKLAEIKDDFVATLTHDLKTPTVAQLKALDLLLSNAFGDLNENQYEIIKQIKNSCKYMNELIFTILDTYLYENGNKKISLNQFCIKELVQEVINETEYLAKDKEQTIKVMSNIIEGNISADRLQIKRVLINLVTNAITHGKSNTEINIYLETEYNKFKFEIRNNAYYISEDNIEEMFEKYKTKSISKYKNAGSGLGLYLSKRIIEKHGGRIYAESFKNGNCIFGFEIPLLQPDVKSISNQIELE